MSGNSDEDFVVDGNADNAKGETRDENNEISVDWSSKLDKIHVEKFIEMYGLTNDLGTNAMAKDFPSFYRLFIPWQDSAQDNASLILERTLHWQLYQFLSEHLPLSPYHHGFQKNHSAISHNFLHRFDPTRNGPRTLDGSCIYWPTKAFDTVDHEILTKKGAILWHNGHRTELVCGLTEESQWDGWIWKGAILFLSYYTWGAPGIDPWTSTFHTAGKRLASAMSSGEMIRHSLSISRLSWASH